MIVLLVCVFPVVSVDVSLLDAFVGTIFSSVGFASVSFVSGNLESVLLSALVLFGLSIPANGVAGLLFACGGMFPFDGVFCSGGEDRVEVTSTACAGTLNASVEIFKALCDPDICALGSVAILFAESCSVGFPSESLKIYFFENGLVFYWYRKINCQNLESPYYQKKNNCFHVFPNSVF